MSEKKSTIDVIKEEINELDGNLSNDKVILRDQLKVLNKSYKNSVKIINQISNSDDDKYDMITKQDNILNHYFNKFNIG